MSSLAGPTLRSLRTLLPSLVSHGLMFTSVISPAAILGRQFCTMAAGWWGLVATVHLKRADGENPSGECPHLLWTRDLLS